MELSVLGLTLQIALVATAIDLPVALLVGWLIVKRRIKGGFFLDVIVSMPLAIPPVAIGYFLLLLLSRGGPLGGLIYSATGRDVVFTWVAASLAAAIVAFPLMVRAIMVAMQGVDERLEMSARSLGAGPWRVVFTITVPLAYKGIVAGVMLGFVRAISEFGATIIVAGNIPGRTQTIPLALFTAVQTGDDNAAIRFVTLSVVIAVASLLAHNWLLKRSRELS